MSWKRWRAFLVGVLLGCVVVYILLFNNRDRDLSFWFPGQRVLNEISSGLNPISDYQCQMDCEQLFPSDIEALFKDGDVDFESSKPRQEIKEYVVNYLADDGFAIKAVFSIQDTTIRMIELRSTKHIDDCECPE